MKLSGQPLSPIAVVKLRHALLAWYDVHRRDLPWRRDPHPYRVWVSEIMLQQTRVAAVLEHYARFLKKFPSVKALAAASEPDVLAAWSGLGYYHRARRLHQAARQIVGEHRGKFPGTAAEWLELSGIGRYTAAAIASIAFGEAVAVVDGNVERVLERLLGRDGGREAAWQRAELLLDRERPGDFNQAMMELGATVCTPKSPQCRVCPIFAWCETRGALEAMPAAARKRKHLAYAVIRCGKCVRLVQRPGNATLMAGMWELPPLTTDEGQDHEPIVKLRHSITDTDYQIAVYELPADDPPHGRWVTRRRLDALPLTGLTRKILRALEPESQTPRRKSK